MTRGRHALESAAALGLLLLAAWLLNVVGGQQRLRADLTAEQRHTLAPLTRALLSRLDAPVEVRAFLPAGVQPPHDEVVRAVRDTLEEYRAAAGGRLTVLVRDPTDPDLDAVSRQALEEEARSFGVQPAELSIFREDKRVRQRVLFGVAFLHRDRHVATPPIPSVEQVEYELTRALREALSPRRRRPVLAIDTGHGGPDVLRSPVAELLEGSAELRPVDLRVDPVPAGADALLLLAPSRPYGERARYSVDQHLMAGKAVVLLADYSKQSEVFPDVLVPITTGLEPLLSHYGLEVDAAHTVVDRKRNGRAPVGRDSGGRVLFTQHPAYVAADVAPHPATAGLRQLVVPLARPIAVAGDPGRRVVALVRSGPDSTLRPELRSMDPARLEAPTPDERPGPAVLAAALQATLTSGYAGKPAPPRPDAALRGAAPEPPKLEAGQGEARLVLVTSGARFLAADPQPALRFLHNAVDWALADTDLLELRARAGATRPLRESTGAERAMVKYGATLLPPVLVLLLGALRAVRRRRRA